MNHHFHPAAEAERDEVHIWAVAHYGRRPDYWLERR